MGIRDRNGESGFLEAGPFAITTPAVTPSPAPTSLVLEGEGPFELLIGEQARRAEQTPVARARYARWSDADDRDKRRQPRDAVGGVEAGIGTPVLVFPTPHERDERVFVLQNFKIDGAALRAEHRAYLDDIARWMGMRPGRWRVFAEAHASRTGSGRHDDDLSEDRFLSTRAYLEIALQRYGVGSDRLRVAGEGVGFRHSPMSGEDPRARSVYVVIQHEPAAHPLPTWPPTGSPVLRLPTSLPATARLDPPRWGPILRARLSSHAMLRAGNAARYLIDGRDTFRAMVEAIRTANSTEHYIYMLNGWQLVDDFPLIAGDPTTTFVQLMSRASALGVQIRAMLWANPGKNFLQTRRIHELKTGAAIRDDETAHPLYGGHHQKILVVKGDSGLIGFCGGVDINSDRVAVVGGTMGEPEHDVHARIIGPASWDVLQTFVRRWDHHPDHVAIDKKRGGLLGRGEGVPRAIGAVVVGSTSSVPVTCSIAIARTFNPVTKGTTVARERDIRTLFLEAIARARRFIYIEDQYLINLEAAKALNAAVPRLAHVTILIPSSEATSGLPCRWKFRRDFIDALTRGLAAADAKKVRIFQRVSTPIAKPPKFGFHTYVHAKTWVIDDELAAIGSANVNRRGWEHDSEAEAFIFDDVAPHSSGTATFAQKLRMDLWAEHLGFPPPTFVDGVASASKWLALPPSASVMRYDPLAGKDIYPNFGCERMREYVDPLGP